jgi:hypothetical protein
VDYWSQVVKWPIIAQTKTGGGAPPRGASRANRRSPSERLRNGDAGCAGDSKSGKPFAAANVLPPG